MIFIPCTILDTIICRTELKNLNIRESLMSQSFLKYLRHMIHIIRECPSDKTRIRSREQSQSTYWGDFNTLWSRIHFRSFERCRTCLSCRQSEIPIHMVDKKNIPIVAHGMNEVINSLTQSRTITCMSYHCQVWS